MFNSSQSQLTFTDELDDNELFDDLRSDLVSQPFSQMNFNDFTLPSQTQSDQFGSQVSEKHTWKTPLFRIPFNNDDAFISPSRSLNFLSATKKFSANR